MSLWVQRMCVPALAGLAMSMAQGAGAADKPGPAQAAAVQPTVAKVLAGSEVSFVAKQLGVPLEGRFKRFEAQIALDPRQPQTGRVSIQLELGSVAINAETDAELVKAEWFNTAKFPKAVFTSRAIKAAGPGRFEVSGSLNIKGVARELTVPVVLTPVIPGSQQSLATGVFTLKRLDFKIGDGDWSDTSIVANDIQVKFKFLLQGLPPL